MQQYSRTDRVAGQIQRVMAELIRDEISDPRLGMISITGVEVARDLSHARIYVSALELAGSDTETSVAVLNGAASLLRHGLGKKIRFRVLPGIQFIADDTERQAVDIEAKIRQARQQDDTAAQRRGDE